MDTWVETMRVDKVGKLNLRTGEFIPYSKEEIKKIFEFSASKEFWKQIHKQAVKFRNEKIKEMIEEKIPKEQHWIINKWEKE